MTWLDTIGSVLTTGALCTWAACDIYRRWNGPTQAQPARSNAQENTVDRGEPQGTFLPGLQAFQQSGSGWYTTTITANYSEQPGAVTLHDLLGPPGHFDLEHASLADFLVHLQQLQGLAGAHRGDLALDRIAQAGPQDFTAADYEMLSALDEGTCRRTPISETQLASLPTHLHVPSLKGPSDASEEEQSCSICLETFKDKEVVKTLPCLHHFHASCIEEWLRREGQTVSCPVCKTPVFEGRY